MSVGDWGGDGDWGGGGDGGLREVSYEGWLSRVGKAIVAIPVGLLLFLASFVLLFWNEGRAVKTAESLKEGASAVVSVPADRVDPAHESALVHVSALATTEETLKDPEFGVTARALRLERVVKMYQWKERKETHTRRRIGGGRETVTEYSYTRDWVDHPISSSQFRQKEGHRNPESWPFRSWSGVSDRVTLGAFRLPTELVQRIHNEEPLPVGDSEHGALPDEPRSRLRPDDGRFYLGRDPRSPEVGDLTVEFRSVPPTEVSLLARQTGDSFGPYKTRNGRDIERLQVGSVTAETMFAAAQAENAMATWFLRAGGLAMMTIGLGFVFGPLAVLADVVPLLGSVVRFGTWTFAFGISLVLSLVTVAIGWMAYRPVVGIAVLAVAALAAVALIRRLRRRQPGFTAPA